MYLKRQYFDPALTQAQVDEIANNMVMNLAGFSEYACLDGRMYGVETTCDTCDNVINGCIRDHASRLLWSNQLFVEKTVEYTLNDRYHTQEIDWTGQGRIQVHPGVTSLHKEQQITIISGMESVSVSPYIVNPVPISQNGSFCLATLDGTLVDNPNRIAFRDTATNQTYITQQQPGYPRRNVDGDWEVALDKPAIPPCEIETIAAHHCQYIVVTIETQNCSGTILPVYKGSKQFIPMAKDPEVVGDNTRYWFYPWVLLDPAFFDEGADLSLGEFYKLLPAIAFACVTEIDCPVSIRFKKLNTGNDIQFEEEDYDADLDNIQVNIVDAQRGVLDVNYRNLSCTSCGCALASCSCKAPVKLILCYKTSPWGLADIGVLREAIAHLTAAELPLKVCECEIKTGFIHTAQHPYNEIRVNPITGENIVNLKYGNTYGHLVFSEKMERATKFNKLRML